MALRVFCVLFWGFLRTADREWRFQRPGIPKWNPPAHKAILAWPVWAWARILKSRMFGNNMIVIVFDDSCGLVFSCRKRPAQPGNDHESRHSVCQIFAVRAAICRRERAEHGPGQAESSISQRLFVGHFVAVVRIQHWHALLAGTQGLSFCVDVRDAKPLTPTSRMKR